ncbi:spore maturation protein [Clostridium fermenticellae]|uniref:Spore maturation protein n=1 Tax=Clostridium fermenticellae TaxID=2068654 RepID=A0A386H0F9_9CLOT|nr:nucleoside recognition domain-containing protein [Clostridium fermenticellae]AYD39128.1 spore maturation protein [Clostridium fermenticellae]
MINVIWFVILIFSIVFGLFTGRGDELSKAIISSADSSIKLIIGLIGIMSLWCGIMNIAKESGITSKLASLLKPILRFVFKDAARDEKTLGYIIMNLTANMMGLSNAATPFGIKAMQELSRLNNYKSAASNDMVLFLVINAVCIQLVPTTVISIRAASGSQDPAVIILPTIISSTISGICGVIICKILQRYF